MNYGVYNWYEQEKARRTKNLVEYNIQSLNFDREYIYDNKWKITRNKDKTFNLKLLFGNAEYNNISYWRVCMLIGL